MFSFAIHVRNMDMIDQATFSLMGWGCGRNGMKDFVKILIPHWKQQKNC